MNRAFIYSAVFHILLIGALLIFAGGEIGRVGRTENQIRIRIRGQAPAHESFQAIPGLPSNSRKEPVPRPAMPVHGGRNELLPASAAAPLPLRSGTGTPEAIPRRNRSPEHHPVSARPAAAPLDPLAGLESALPGEASSEEGSWESWNISWQNGGKRGIVKSPVIDRDALPVVTEHMVDVVVRIEVSAQGEVLSAQIEDPGSGDVRIDRYISGKALDFAFEKVLDYQATQVGLLHIVFEGGIR